MICNKFDAVMREYLDYSDRNTVRALSEASEDNQSQILTALTSRLYDMIVEKADQIDYSTISKSRGDITKIEKFDQLQECVDLIRKIVIEYKQSTKSVDVVNTAIENMKKRTDLFKKAFSVDSPIPKMLYNNIALAIVNSVSFLIATCIEYVKSPTAETFEMALDVVAYNKTMNHLLFKTLNDFNEGCKSNEFDEALKLCLKKRIVANESAEIEVKDDTPYFTPEEIEDDEEIVHDDEAVDEAFFPDIFRGIASGLIFILKCFIPIIRNIVYFFYSTRQTITDFFNVNAGMLEMNAYQLQYNNNMDADKKDKVYQRQMKIAGKFRNIANKFAIDNANASKNAEKIKNEEDRKYNVEDLAYEYAASGENNLF